MEQNVKWIKCTGTEGEEKNVKAYVGKKMPLTKEKLQMLKKLIKEQLDAKYIDQTTSSWNSPVFVI